MNSDQTAVLASPARTRLVLVASGIACAVGFVVLGLLVREVPGVDRWAQDRTAVAAGSPVGRIAQVVSSAAVLFGLVVLVLVAVRVSRSRRDRLPTVAWTAGLVLACGSLVLLQNVFQRPGPPGQPGFSYPSGHATVAGAIAATAVVLAAVHLRPRLRTVLVAQCAAVVLTMVSRVALAEHYLTDVLGAVLGVTAVGLIGAACFTGRASEWTGVRRRSGTGRGRRSSARPGPGGRA